MRVIIVEIGVLSPIADGFRIRRVCGRARAHAHVGVEIYRRIGDNLPVRPMISKGLAYRRCVADASPMGVHNILSAIGHPRSCMRSGEKYSTEAEEQAELARRLDSAGLVWFAVPNGGSRHVLEARNLVRQGVKSGVPDLVILSPTPAAPRGVALELKRAPPVGTLGDVRPDQWAWLARFEAEGFRTLVGLGWRDSVRQLQRLGYEVQG